MALTVEDGTGLTDADSFVSVAECDAYHLARGNTTWTGSDSLKEAALRRASLFLSNAYPWQGWQFRPRLQALAWPRGGVVDQDGFDVRSDEVPVEIRHATCEVALRELVSPGAMNPDVTTAETVKSVTAGSVSVQFANAGPGAGANRPTLLVVRDLIAGLLRTGSGGLFGRAARV
jgi:hypothetical protein